MGITKIALVSVGGQPHETGRRITVGVRGRGILAARLQPIDAPRGE